MNYTCKELPGKSYASKEAMFSDLRVNKDFIIAQKKMTTKEADAVVFFAPVANEKGEAVKADIDLANATLLKMSLAINTTNLLDSHSDVHIKGIWKKSVKEIKQVYLLQEHKMLFDKIITDKVRPSVKTMSWAELGYNYPGDTEVLVFDVDVNNKRNPFMFEQYGKGYVTNHSVGMRYVSLELAMNSESKWDVEEKEAWDKYIDQVANKEDAEDQGYFWAVTEAKIVEGSAVVKGSNPATPTMSIEIKEAGASTSHTLEPATTTHPKATTFINPNLF